MSARVVIAGAGIGGLTAAVALRRAGHEVVLLERMPELAEIGGGITLAPNAKIALRHLGLAEAVEAAGAPLEHFEHRKRDGETIASWPLLAVAEMVGEGGTGLPRPELQRILHGAIDRAELRLGAEVTAVEEDGGMAIARLAGGEEVRGDVLVGADGLHSTIRPRFDPTPLRYAGYTAWRGVARLGDAADSLVRPGVQVQTYGRGSVFGTIPIGGGLVYWFAAYNAPAGGEDEPGRRKAALLELFAGWHEPISSLIEASDEAAITRTDVYDLPRRERWGSGRATLLGDAAHPTTPTLGQGACMAIEDGVVLARQLGSHDDPVAALRAFEAERIPRTARIVGQSRMRGRMVLRSGRLSTSIRDRVLASLPQRATLRALSGMFRFEP